MRSMASFFFLFCLFVGQASGDQARLSLLKIWAENDEVIVLHSHDVNGWSVAKSEIRILSKADGHVITRFESAPLTKLVTLAEDNFFVGLSDFQAAAEAKGYNFILFDAAGAILATALVQSDSVYCPVVYPTMSQFIYWFDPMYPDPTLMKQHHKISAIRINGLSHQGKATFCELPFGEHASLKQFTSPHKVKYAQVNE